MTSYPSFGAFLRTRRTQIDPGTLGLGGNRRRTPGLRREEVAQRAGISTVWYSCLERGRGGPPSADVVERLADALLMTEAEREHLFLLGLGRPPEPRIRMPTGATPRLQRVLDEFETSPALVRTATWDVVAWNAATQRVMTDWSRLATSERNVLRRVFLDPASRRLNPDWRRTATLAVGSLRADTARAGASVLPFVEDLKRESPEFAAIWQEANVRGLDEGERRLRHPVVGDIAFGLSSFAVDGRPDLVMLVHTPATNADKQRVRTLLGAA